MKARFTLTTTKYGGVGIYDAETGQVAPFMDDDTAQAALLAILDGKESPDLWLWREAYAQEVTF